MAAYLKSAAVLVVVMAVLSGSRFVWLVIHDEEFQRAAFLKERNAGNVLFESEYRVAKAGHILLIYSAVSCFLVALIGGSLLWGVGALHTKVDGRSSRAP
jgi:hypothetical protein